jgi:transcription antitermination factor NusG
VGTATATLCVRGDDAAGREASPICTFPWYALHTRSSHEFMVRDQLQARGIDAFLPSYVRYSRWRTRRVPIETPLFAGYLFARFEFSRSIDAVRRVRGLAQIVQAAVAPDVIENLQRATRNPEAVGPAIYQAGELVTVVNGPFAGLSGVIERTRTGQRLIVTLALLQRACAVEIGSAEVIKANARR